jgi:hypothetical protein
MEEAAIASPSPTLKQKKVSEEKGKRKKGGRGAGSRRPGDGDGDGDGDGENGRVFLFFACFSISSNKQHMKQQATSNSVLGARCDDERGASRNSREKGKKSSISIYNSICVP